MEQLAELDKDLFFILNGLHTAWLDPVMYYISQTLTWLPVYLLFMWLLIKNFGWRTVLWLTGLALAITLADQVTSGLMKPFFERFRPSRDPSFEEGLVHIVNGYRGGKFGFASSHAANAFAVATYLYLLLRNSVRYSGYLFVMAALIAYSRIYLGVHYPADVIAGGAIGIVAGSLCYRLAMLANNKWLKSTA
ncbi:phosphatase PAP2 family protein [Fulvivirga sedimenti]|uniref:Phosphatase PAP2 family protein n=1 Tax=Fulvivirga sedimenti TaxID=2879465 RepID=A0A9X1HSG4_9BACT|nr:phosphatase PAP2 family protein [Fulvivirga sedimenti]MCA6074956.1 phosphatase PAP2 family protein [Fulvivirga sedimenti]MCA6076133.1 phosphatase PAP2 family protein [Fulvivirga sedimenti]MCA6077261.1 phosphatase PAP2 family protein [Fulvivirga sedimenti]